MIFPNGFKVSGFSVQPSRRPKKRPVKSKMKLHGNLINLMKFSCGMAGLVVNAPRRSLHDAEATRQIRPVLALLWPASRKQELVQQPVPLNRDR
jgi:hypothetical protein